VAGLVRRVRFTLSGMTATITVGALLDEHVVLDVQCLDRIVRHEALCVRVEVRDLHRQVVAAA
jgi:hypothetical protein